MAGVPTEPPLARSGDQPELPQLIEKLPHRLNKIGKIRLNMKKTFEILSVIGLLMIAAFFDTMYQDAKQVDPTSLQSNISSLFWLRIFSTLLITLLLLLVVWYLLCHSSNDLVVTSACILLGVLVLISVTIPGTRIIAQINLSNNVLGAWITDIVSSNLSLTSHVAAFIFAIGIFRLLPLSRK